MVAVIPVGERFGKWIVIERGYHVNDKHVYWRCRCDCGAVKTIMAGNVRAGKTISCGCIRPKLNARQTPLYGTWKEMVSRCHDKRNHAYADYGGRGIAVCSEWRNNLQAFVRDMGQRPDGHTLDRINNNGDYTPHNCKWSTPREQARNRRSNRYITIKGETKLACDWAAELGINQSFFCERSR